MADRVNAFLNQLKSHAPMFALVVGAIATSIILIPGPRERANQDFKAGHVAAAISQLKELVAAGDHSVWTLTTLAQAHEEFGDVEGAIAALELLLTKRPKNVVVLQMLDALYKGVGNSEQRIRILERLQVLSPSYERQQLIVRLWGELDRRNDQLEAVRVLLDVFRGGRDDYLLLARLEASAGQPAAAARTLQKLSAKEKVDARVISWELSLWVAAGQVQHAVERGRSWLEQTGRLQAAEQLAAVFASQSLHEPTVAMLRPFAGPTAPPEFIAILAGAEYDSGDIAAAVSRLDQFEAAYGASPKRDLKLLNLRLALRVDRARRALAVVDDLGIESLPLDLLSDLAEAALRIHRVDVLDRIRHEAADTFALFDPLLLAQIYFAVGDVSIARHLLDRLANESLGDPVRMVATARLQLRMGRRDQALASLRSVTGAGSGRSLDGRTIRAARPAAVASSVEAFPAAQMRAAVESVPPVAVPPYLLREIAWLYIKAGAVHEGRLALERFRRWQPSLEADYAWAITAIRSSRQREVESWLRSTGARLGPERLKELAYVASGAGAHALAADAARLLVYGRGTDADRLLLAETRIAAGRPWSPVPLRQLKPAAALR